MNTFKRRKKSTKFYLKSVGSNDNPDGPRAPDVHPDPLTTLSGHSSSG